MLRRLCVVALLLVGACDDDEPMCPAADAALPQPDAAAAPDATLPDASLDPVPCGHVNEACCRIGDACRPGLGCVSSVPFEGVCVPLPADGGP